MWEFVWDLLFFFVATVVFPVVINKTTDSGYLDWLKPYLRHTWTGMLVFFSAYMFSKPYTIEAAMNLHKRLPGLAGYIVAGLFGSLLLCVYWWMTGTLFNKKTESQPLSNKISVYERNTYKWDHEGDPNVPTQITSETLLRKPTQGTTGEAFLTPVIGIENSSEIIAAGTNLIITIHYPEGTPVSFGPHKIWRAMDAVPRNKQRFTALLEQSVVPGRVKWGPDEMIRAKLPIGKYKVDYFIQGRSEKGEPFTVERSCNIEIYRLP